MPRRKGHGIPPTKCVKPDVITRSAPLKNKLYNEIPVVTAKEESLQMTVNAVPIKSEPPSIISDALHSKYLHKKFKKMASTLLSEEHQNQINCVLNGSRVKTVSRNSLSPASSDNERASPRVPSPRANPDTPVSSPPAGRYVCSYCKLACAKPSVLQKHIRAHTNERPYPCLPCGFAFKTKSNLYKHCRSRAHAAKLEETGEKMPAFDAEEGVSSGDDSLSNVSTTTSVASRTGPEIESREEMPKSIYKPKYRFMDPPVESDKNEKSDERKENTNSPPRLHLKIPVPNSTPPVSTPSPFTSGSSPSPEFLHRHINKLISENQAIVETNDPFWSKKFLQKTNSSDNLPVYTLPIEAFPKKTVRNNIVSESSEDSNCDKQGPKHSKLALALLRPQTPVSPKFPNQPSSDICDAQPLNLTMTGNKEESSTTHNRKRSYSEGIAERSPKLLKERINTVPLKLHNHSVQDFRRFASTLSENNASMLLNHLDIKKDILGNPQNPEGSIIKDLLLKARAANTAINSSLLESLANSKPLVPLTPPISDERAYSPSSQFMCHLCKDSVSYRTAENLELHQMYHCKGNDTSSRSSLNSPSPRSVSPSYHNTISKETSMIIAPSHPSPGPLLGSTPLVDSYRTSPNLQNSNPSLLKRRKFDIAENLKIESAATFRTLEGMTKSPSRSSVQMFGGEVKILDHGETKTLRIDPSSRTNSKRASLPIPSRSNNVIKKEDDLQESDSNIVVTIAKQGLHTGGSIIQVPKKGSVGEITTRLVSSSENTLSFSSVQHLTGGYMDSPKMMIPLMSNSVTSCPSLPGLSPSVHHLPFQFSPMMSETPVINPLTNITAYNPLTLPPATGPHSPGIPSMYSPGIVTILHGGKEIPFVPGMPGPHSLLSPHTGPSLISRVEADKLNKFTENKSNTQMESAVKSPKHEKVAINKPSSLNIPTLQLNNEKIDNSAEQRGSPSPRKRTLDESLPSISSSKSTVPKRPQVFTLPSETKDEENSATEKKFLRPSSLPLKPGTFVPKRQQSTPVLSLVSPETPRPRKSYGQLYLNGHAYTYLGLKCSTRMFFCTLNKPQPIYVPLSPEHNKVSMYSNWKVCTEADPNPCGLDPGRAMALYDSRHRPNLYTQAHIRNSEAVTHSTYWTNRPTQVNKEESAEAIPKRVKIFAGGFESNEEYTYVRGRGRGRYVCEECGIRCKKPSMLKKHIRTHTDVRPFTCLQCKFSFKTKGNLTKHMKSKAHYKKCVNMGIDPVPTIVDDSNVDEEALARQQALRETRGSEVAESEDEDEEEEDETDDEEEEDEDEGEGEENCVEQEAARSLLSLSETLQTAAQKQHVSAGLMAASARPNTYPYSYTHSAAPATEPQTPTLTSISAQREREKVSQNTGLAREVQQHVSREDAVSASDKGHYYFPPSQDSAEPAQVKQPTPMDLSHKPPEKPTRVCEEAMLLATLCSTMERLPITTTSPSVSEDSTLLQAYLTERAVHDSRIKQHQYKPKAVTSEVSPEPERLPVSRIDISAAKENALGILAQTSSDVLKVSSASSESESVTPTTSTPTKPQAEFLPPSSGPSSRYVSVLEDGRSMCNICNKVFSKPSQLRLHVNIHYFERPFRCEACAVSFRTKGHLQKHQRSVSHLNKVNMNSTFGTATTTNPRPFKCDDCKIAFRIHGHLAKHLRSKMHIMKLECLGKLPFGTYAELERSGMNMNDIDTTDCENSLESLQLLAQKLYEKDPSKLGQWDPNEMMPHHHLSSGDTSSEGEDDEMPLPTDHPPHHLPLHTSPAAHHLPPPHTSPAPHLLPPPTLPHRSPDRTKTEAPSDRRTNQPSVANQCL